MSHIERIKSEIRTALVVYEHLHKQLDEASDQFEEEQRAGICPPGSACYSEWHKEIAGLMEKAYAAHAALYQMLEPADEVAE